jgi:hypothetical protein
MRQAHLDEESGKEPEALTYAREFRETIIAHDARVVAEAFNKAANFLDTPGVLWHGDGGVTVKINGNHVKLTDWLRQL